MTPQAPETPVAKRVGYDDVAALLGATQETQWIVPCHGRGWHFVCLHMPNGPNIVLPYGVWVVQDGDAVVVLPSHLVGSRPVFVRHQNALRVGQIEADIVRDWDT